VDTLTVEFLLAFPQIAASVCCCITMLSQKTAGNLTSANARFADKIITIRMVLIDKVIFFIVV
jgi:hypothetical protein